jgi:hypothetical protein
VRQHSRSNNSRRRSSDKLAEAQTKSELAQAETQGKLDALIHMWDEMIRERGRKNGDPSQPPQ